MEDFADPEQGGHRDGPSGFNLLPVPRGEAERDHVFLAETLGFPQLADPAAQPRKEFCLI